MDASPGKIRLWRMHPPPGADIPTEAGDPGSKRPVGVFSEIERRRIGRFLARGDMLDDIARQMRCEVADIGRIERLAKGRRRGRGPPKPG